MFSDASNPSALRALDIPATGTPRPEFVAVDSAVTAMMSRYAIPGAALGLVHNGRLVYLRGYGYSNTQSGSLVQPSSRFRIASISKPLTAAAALALVDQGRLSLDTPAFSLLQDLTPVPGASVDPRIASITVRELLEHEGGWDRSASFDPMFYPRDAALAVGTSPPADCPTIIRWMLGFPLDFTPGTQSVYSNFGYCVLGQVIARVAGMAYGPWVKQAVLDPLTMSSTQLGQTISALTDEVKYYDYSGAPLATSVFDGTTQVTWPYGGFAIEAMDAHGGWVSTTSDLLRLLANLDGSRGGSLLHQTYLGYGLYEGEVPPSAGSSWYFQGSLPGTRTILALDGDNAWALLTNTWRRDTDFDQADPLWNDIHTAVATVTSWPSTDLFTPSGPQNVQATQGDGKATVSFLAPALDGGSAIQSYTVTASPGGASASGTASPITVTGLTNGTSYTLTVRATNGYGIGAATASSGVTPAGLPGAPSGAAASAGDGQATVRFTVPSANGSPILSYTVTASPGGQSTTGSGSPVFVTGLSNGTSYTFTVTATTAVGVGSPSTPSVAVVPSPTPGERVHPAPPPAGSRAPVPTVTAGGTRPPPP